MRILGYLRGPLVAMRKAARFLAVSICVALFQTSVHCGIKYWDIDGATADAGGPTPSGTWDTGKTANWTTDPGGASAGTTWADGEDAVFSAGTDATGTFTITLDSTVLYSAQTAGNLTVEEGNLVIDDPSYSVYLDIGAGVTGKGIINVASGLNATINAALKGGDDRGQITKTGMGTLTLGRDNFDIYGGTNVVAEGVLAVTSSAALGDLTIPTIVSNGAALHAQSSLDETIILHGSGFDGVGGALLNIAGIGNNGGVILGADVRINNEAGGTWNWLGGVGGNVGVDGTSAGGAFSVTFGGNGGTTQLKNSYRTIILNNVPIYKDGTSTLRFETPTIGVSACYLDGGWILSRTASAGNFLPAGSPIYVGPGAGGFDSGLNASPALYSPMVLAAGANPAFNIRLSQGGQPQTWDQNGVISGSGGLSKTNVGTLFLNRHNTYSGNTTIQWGILALGANGSISNSAVIDVQSTNSIFNVTSNANGFVVEPAQILQGNGVIWGNVAVNGTISPGTAIGILTFSNNLTLNVGTKILIEVDKGFPTNDFVTVLGVLTNSSTGTVIMTNANPGAPLAPGDAFQIFSQPVLNGQALTVSGAGMLWTNKLAVDGSIAVVSVAPPQEIRVPHMTSVTLAGPVGVRVTWTNALVGTNYWLQYATNLNSLNWTDLNPVRASGATAFQVDGVPIGDRQRYYRVRFQIPGGAPPTAIPRITSVTFPGVTVVNVNYTNTLPGTNYVVQYRSNLDTTNWTSLGPITAGGPASATTDNFPSVVSQRFYRVYYVTE